MARALRRIPRLLFPNSPQETGTRGKTWEKSWPHRGEVSGEAARAEGAGVHRAAGQRGGGGPGQALEGTGLAGGQQEAVAWALPAPGARGGSEACDRPGQSDPPNQGSVPGAAELRVERSQLFQGKKAGSMFPSEGLGPWRACRSARGADPARPCCLAGLVLRHWPG